MVILLRILSLFYFLSTSYLYFNFFSFLSLFFSISKPLQFSRTFYFNFIPSLCFLFFLVHLFIDSVTNIRHLSASVFFVSLSVFFLFFIFDAFTSRFPNNTNLTLPSRSFYTFISHSSVYHHCLFFLHLSYVRLIFPVIYFYHHLFISPAFLFFPNHVCLVLAFSRSSDIS